MMLALGGAAILVSLIQIVRTVDGRLWNVALVLMMVGLLLPDATRRWPGLFPSGDHPSVRRFLLTTAILLMFTNWLYDRYRTGRLPTTAG